MGLCPPKAGTDNVVCGPPIYHGCWSIPERIQIERIRYLCEKCTQLEFDGGQTVSWPRFLWTPHCPLEPRRNGPHEGQFS